MPIACPLSGRVRERGTTTETARTRPYGRTTGGGVGFQAVAPCHVRPRQAFRPVPRSCVCICAYLFRQVVGALGIGKLHLSCAETWGISATSEFRRFFFAQTPDGFSARQHGDASSELAVGSECRGARPGFVFAGLHHALALAISNKVVGAIIISISNVINTCSRRFDPEQIVSARSEIEDVHNIVGGVYPRGRLIAEAVI